MAVIREANLLSQQRFDIPHIRGIESAVAGDFDVLAGRSWGGQQQLVVRGFQLTNISAGTPATSLQLSTADGILFNSQADVSGTMLWVPPDRAVETLNPVTNPRVIGGWTPGGVSPTVNYVGLLLTRNADASTTDLVQFLDSETDQETPKQVPLAKTIDYTIQIGTVPFSGQSDLIPIAKVSLDSASHVSSVQDARSMVFRLASGSDTPNPYSFFAGWTRREGLGTVDNTLFQGGDKQITSLKQWQDAVMTRLWEGNGGEFWYSATADRNVELITYGSPLANGEYFSWNLGTNTLTYQNLRLLFDNSTSYNADIGSGTAVLAPGDCLYVDADRTQFYSPQWLTATTYAVGDLVVNNSNAYECTASVGPTAGGPSGTGQSITDGGATWKFVGPGVAGALTPQAAHLATLGTGNPPGSRWILAWRRGADIFTRGWRYPVGTTFQPATTTSLGEVKLSRNATTPLAPIVISDEGGVITTSLIGDVGLKIKRFDGGADILEWRTAADGALGNIDNDGDINFASDSREITWPSWKLSDTSSDGTGPAFIEVGGSGRQIGLFGNVNLFHGTGGSIARISATPGAVGFGPSSGGTYLYFETAGTLRWKILNTNGQLTGLSSTGIDIDPTAKYTYTTVRSRSQHIPAEAFLRTSSYGDGRIAAPTQLGSDGGAFRNGSWQATPRALGDNARLQVKAQVRIPHGAVLTNLTALYAVDYGDTGNTNNVGQGRLQLLRRVFSAGAITTTKLNSGSGSFGSGGTGGVVVAETNIGTNAHTFDNSNATYELTCDLNSEFNWENRVTNPYTPLAGNGGTACCVLSDGRVLVAGGYAGTTAVTGAVIYDPLSGLVTAAANMNHARAGHRMYTFTSGKAVAFGGHTGDGTTRVQSAELYDFEANTWTDITGTFTNALNFTWLPHPRGDVLYCLSGTTAGQEKVLTFINESSVGALASTSANRVGGALAFYYTSFANDDIRMGVYGGGANLASATNTWESYNTLTDTWTNGTGTLAAARVGALAITLPNGNVFLVGGAASASCEIGSFAGGDDHTMNFNAQTAPSTNFSAGRIFMTSDGSVVAMPTNGVGGIFKWQNIGSGGTWSRYAQADGFSLDGYGYAGGGPTGDICMLVNDEFVRTNTRSFDHAVTQNVWVRPYRRVPNVRFYGCRINYDLTEVNVET